MIEAASTFKHALQRLHATRSHFVAREWINTVEAFQFDAGPVTAERCNRGFTLIHVATGTPIARLRPVKGHDGLFNILYWSL